MHAENIHALHTPTGACAAVGSDPSCLADIYQADTNIAIWRRDLPVSITQTVASFVDANPSHRTAVSVAAENAEAVLNDLLGDALGAEITHDIAELVDMFCLLFNLERAGIRLGVLDSAMCPKFHVDKIPARLVTTYQGVATEWLPNDRVDRSKLGHGSGGLADDQSGLYSQSSDVQCLMSGDVALMKGDTWEGCEGQGLVHRSPDLASGQKRLMLTLDFMN